MTPKASLKTLVKETPDWTPETPPDMPHEAKAAKLATPKRKSIAERCVDLADVQPPGELPLLFGQYLLKGSGHWLTGQTGLGKSTWAFNLACALAEGTPLWGIECGPLRVLYVDMESGDVGRALKIERLYRDSPRVRGNLLFVREAIRLPDELVDLLAFVREGGIGLVIFDTARRCFTVKDENDNAEVYRAVVPTLDALKAAGVATLTMGHPPKNGGAGARGAGAQEDAGDVNLTLTMHRGEVNDADGIIGLRVTKNRLLGLNIPPLYLRRVGDDQFERVEATEANQDLASDSQDARPKKELCADALLDHLKAQADGCATHRAMEEAATGAGFRLSTFNAAFAKLRDEGKIVRATEGRWSIPDPFADNDYLDAIGSAVTLVLNKPPNQTTEPI